MLYHLWTYTSALVGTLRNRDEGATIVEYGLLLAAIVVVVATTVILVGTKVLGWFTSASVMAP